MPGKRDVAILEVHPVGNYAVRLVFDDMHSTGIYSWDYFMELGRNHDRYWQDYLDELAAKGLSRDPQAALSGSAEMKGRRMAGPSTARNGSVTAPPPWCRPGPGRRDRLTSSLVMRKQPDDTALPIVSGSFEP